MKKKASKKTHRTSLIVATLVVIFSVIIAVGIYQSLPSPSPQNPPKPKVPAAEYFEIFDATVDDANPKYNSTGAIVAWEMYALRYKLKAVGGDAHDVVIRSWAMAEPENFPLIQKGENVTVTQTTTKSPPAPYLLNIKNADGKFKFTVNLRSAEAEGAIDIWL